jgi:hypothetical protein
MTRGHQVFSIAFSFVLLFSLTAFAQDDAAAKAEAEAMKKWMEAATPGPQHAMLAAYAGEWNADSKWWQSPQAEPQSSKGTCTFEAILGGRYLHMVYKGDWNGQPWTGIGYLAYENFTKKFEGTWIDEMSTGLFYNEGTADESGKVVTMIGKMSDPSTGELDKPAKDVWTFGDNKIVFEMYDNVGTDKEFKNMEIVYTRIK